ncbi:hypothetical protein C8J56DRAFT_782506 [Mycena floridula]|nr:hypothetical protein C8J56DRAFT_782506 [Mycena floridula]
MSGTPIVIPPELAPYNTYLEDPKWQLKFTYIWVSCVATAVVFCAPSLVLSLMKGRALTGFWGIREEWGYKPVSSTSERLVANRSTMNIGTRVSAVLKGLGGIVYWTPPGIEHNAAQIFVILSYLVIVLVCVILKAPLMSNPNRAGFLAIAQLPPVFLFATKNSVVSILLGPGHGYEKLNYLHRWSARGLFLGAVVHGALWIRNHLVWNIPILGQQKETSGVATLGVLCVLVLTSWRGVRRLSWQFFWVVHILGFPAFFITLCYHTIYASPWIFPPLAFYGLDILLRMFRFRIKDASLISVDSQMTIANCTSGWLAGQHIRLRVFFEGRVFESHPLTIMSAPQSTSCLRSDEDDVGILLGARARGDWTRALNAFAQEEQKLLNCLNEKTSGPVPVQVLIDGPYGGCSVDLGNYETVLLFAGGSGATFTIGLLDEIVGRCVLLNRSRGEKTRRIEFSWCIRSFGAIDWFSSYLMQIAQKAAQSDTLDLHISIYVTCLCDPEAIPPIPNCDVTIIRPAIHKVLKSLLTPPANPKLDAGRKGSSDEDIAEEAAAARNISHKLTWVGLGGGLAVCAAGPETMTREASNAVARIDIMNSLKGGELGLVGLHTELFSV